MAVKRIFNLNDAKSRNCLRCGHTIPKEAFTPMSDNKTGVCPKCGQAHFIDINGSRCTLTVAERPEIRRRPKEVYITTKYSDTQELKIKELEAELETAKKNAKEWEDAAEGLARIVENLTEEKKVGQQ